MTVSWHFKAPRVIDPTGNGARERGHSPVSDSGSKHGRGSLDAIFRRRFRFLVLVLWLVAPLPAARQASVPAVVQAILFYSPTCPHCHAVLTETLPPIAEQYGEQLQLLIIDTSLEAGRSLYQATVLALGLPEQSWVVPLLIVGEEILVGGYEIDQRFPGLIEEGLVAGGIGWPDIPRLAEIVPDLPPSANPSMLPPAEENLPPSTTASSGQPAVSAEQPTDLAPKDVILPSIAAMPAASATQNADPFTLSLEEVEAVEGATDSVAPPIDPVGFAIGWVVLVLLLVGLAYGSRRIALVWPTWSVSGPYAGQSRIRVGFFALLVVVGLAVSSYLTYVELTHVKAVCGPVGECNIVQSSPYARIVGIPVALLGTGFYMAVSLLWILRQPREWRLLALSNIGLPALTLLGTLFSIYLTLLELLVIHAVCAWCLTSAIVTMALFLIVARSLKVDRAAMAQAIEPAKR